MMRLLWIIFPYLKEWREKKYKEKQHDRLCKMTGQEHLFKKSFFTKPK